MKRLTRRELRSLLEGVLHEARKPSKKALAQKAADIAKDVIHQWRLPKGKIVPSVKRGKPVSVFYRVEEYDDPAMAEFVEELFDSADSGDWDDTYGRGRPGGPLKEKTWVKNVDGFEVTLEAGRYFRSRDNETKYRIMVSVEEPSKPEPDGYGAWVAKTGTIYD